MGDGRFQKARLADGHLQACIKCGTLALVFSDDALYCQDCRNAADRARSLRNYYRRKQEQGKPLHSPLGAPRKPDTPRLADEPVYDAERMDASNRPVKLTCKRGHPLEGSNLYIGSGGRRICRACVRDNLRRYRTREYWEAKLAQPAPSQSLAPPKPAPDVARLRRVASMTAPLAEFWPYGADDPLVAAIRARLSNSLPEHVRADAGQQVYLDCLEGRVREGDLDHAIRAAVKQSWGEYAISIDQRREDGFSLAELIADESEELTGGEGV